LRLSIGRARPKGSPPYPAGVSIGLLGDRAGFWNLTVTGNWRLIFRFEGGDALDLDLVGYQ